MSIGNSWKFFWSHRWILVSKLLIREYRETACKVKYESLYNIIWRISRNVLEDHRTEAIDPFGRVELESRASENYEVTESSAIFLKF